MSWSYVTPRRRNRQACSSVHIPGTPSALFGPTTTAANTPPDQDIARNPRSAQATRTAQPLTVKPYHVVLRKTGLELLLRRCGGRAMSPPRRDPPPGGGEAGETHAPGATTPWSRGGR